MKRESTSGMISSFPSARVEGRFRQERVATIEGASRERRALVTFLSSKTTSLVAGGMMLTVTEGGSFAVIPQASHLDSGVQGEARSENDVAKEQRSKKRESFASPFELKGFQEYLCVSPEQVGELIQVLPGVKMRGADIASIVIDPKKFRPIQYVGLEGKDEVAHCYRFDDGSGVQIEITDTRMNNNPNNADVRELIYVIVQEVFHAINPQFASGLTVEQRAELLSRLQRIARSPHRPLYGCDEKNQPYSVLVDSQKEAQQGYTTELFAKLMTDVVRAPLQMEMSFVTNWDEWENVFAMWYFSMRKTDRNVAAECAQLAARSLQSLDPDRKPWKWSQEWSTHFNQLMADHQLQRIEKDGIKRVQDLMLKALLQSPVDVVSSSTQAESSDSSTEIGFTYAETLSPFSLLIHYLDKLEAARRGEMEWDQAIDYTKVLGVLQSIDLELSKLSASEKRIVYLHMQALWNGKKSKN